MKKTHIILSALVALVLTVGGVVYYATDWLEASVLGSNRTVTEKQCIKIKKWFDEGTLTTKHRAYVSRMYLCAEKYSDMWYGRNAAATNAKASTTSAVPTPTAARCKELRALYDQGRLSKKKLDSAQAEICGKLFKEIWFAR